jgi:uncharacterized RDD family membrane protein YckC
MVQLYSGRSAAGHPNLAGELSAACSGLLGPLTSPWKDADSRKTPIAERVRLKPDATSEQGKRIDADFQEALRNMAIPNPYAPPQAVVTDVVKAAGMVRADPGTRLGAVLLDSIIAGAMIMLPAGVTMALATAMASMQQGTAANIMTVVTLMVFAAGLVAWGWLTIKFVNENGQTIAKKIVGIKVIRSDGSPASLGRIFWLRNVVNVLLSVIPLYNLVEVMFIFGDARQCLHDKIADTIVVRA